MWLLKSPFFSIDLFNCWLLWRPPSSPPLLLFSFSIVVIVRGCWRTKMNRVRRSPIIHLTSVCVCNAHGKKWLNHFYNHLLQYITCLVRVSQLAKSTKVPKFWNEDKVNNFCCFEPKIGTKTANFLTRRNK